ncbi:MAG: tetratricopeptide repeat protein [Kiritimatiellae bacterium]|nr:tetratricopeptide repeat protein [Kiritimatiellia bacterium]
MSHKRILTAAAALAVAAAFAAGPYTTPGPGMGYATDAYPGFDSEANILPREKKTPPFFSWWSGLESDSPEGQAAVAAAYGAAGEWKKARKAYEALVEQWPASDLAPAAQKHIADICRNRLYDWEDAFDEYKYLADFYSSQCDYDAAVFAMFEMAKKMRQDGKTILFFRFANTTDVRRAFESVVKHAPGAPFAPEAMMAVAELREDEQDWDDAAKVYESVRMAHPKSREAAAALMREAEVRMKILEMHGYNRSRCIDTSAFLDMAMDAASGRDEREKLAEFKKKTDALVEEEAWKAAAFYDSRTRTRSSAISALERFLAEHPAGTHAQEARDKLAALRSGGAAGGKDGKQ